MMVDHRKIIWFLILGCLTALNYPTLAQSKEFFMRVEVDTSTMRGDQQVVKTIRSGGGIVIPSNPINIPLNEYQRATFHQDRNETYLSAVNMMNQVTLKFNGSKPGEFVLPQNPSNSPKVRVFLADIQPILDGSLISGKIVITDYVPGEFIQGSFNGEEKVAGHDLFFSIKGEFRLPSVIR